MLPGPAISTSQSRKPCTPTSSKVGLPQWTEADQILAKALQKELKVPARGLATELRPLAGPDSEDTRTSGGGSDDIGGMSWNVPTIRLSYPSNIPNLPGHNWSTVIAMATPIAHKGATAGAKSLVMTLVDLVTTPALVQKSVGLLPQCPNQRDEVSSTYLNHTTNRRSG